jgi:hypothetical protein
MSEALIKTIKEMDDKDVLDEYKGITAVVDTKFYEPELLKHIHAELDVKHKLDHKEKVATFIVVTSAYLLDPRDHCSCALKGNSSSGKDSNTDNVLSHFPKEDWIKVTRVTTATLEDDVQNKRIIAFSEINKNRENGANAEIVETFKQMAEGGTSTLKKDIKTGFKTAVRTEQEQKTLIYGTTETESDDELETRYVIVPIRGYREKNKIVVDDVLNKASDEEYYLRRHNQDDSWIATSISLLDKDVQVIIPFSKELSGKINGKEIFDTTKDRVKRDVKRILSLTRAIAWLHQKQRAAKYRDGITFIYAEPSDFLNALNLFGDFFNLTYSGLDHRLVKLLEYVEKNVGKHAEIIKALGFQERYHDWTLRHKAQKALNIASVKTIRDWCQKLSDRNRLEVYKDDYVSKKTVLIRPVISPAHNLALPVSIDDIARLLQAWLESDSTKQIYQNHEIKPFLLQFEDYIPENEDDSEDSETFTEENTMSKSTGEEELIVTEEFIEDEPKTFITQKRLDETEEKEDDTAN